MVWTDKDLVPLNKQTVSLCFLCPSRSETTNLWGSGTSKPLFPNVPHDCRTVTGCGEGCGRDDLHVPICPLAEQIQLTL